MDDVTIKKQLIDALKAVAPEIEPNEIDSSQNLQDQLDLDSVDILNYITKVQEAFGIEIPNKDFRAFMTLNEAMAYLQKSVS
jgi:acyl carrier protein